MCRLFAYAAPRSQTLSQIMGASELADFADLSRLHHDGWGAAWLRGPHDDEGYQPDAPEAVIDRGETIARLRSTRQASTDAAFDRHARSARSTAALLHLRWASAGMPVELANQHPFATFATPLPGQDADAADGESAPDEAVFAHNGTIRWTPALTALGARRWRAAGQEPPAVLGSTDSERYFWFVRASHAAGASWADAVAHACREIRRHAEPCALNAVLLTPAQLIVVHASGGCHLHRPDDVDELPRDHAEAYYDMWLRRADGCVCATSSGIEADGWRPLPDETVVVVDCETLDVSTIPLA